MYPVSLNQVLDQLAAKGCRGGIGAGLGCAGRTVLVWKHGGRRPATRPLPGDREAFKEAVKIWEGGGSASPAELEFTLCAVHWGYIFKAGLHHCT